MKNLLKGGVICNLSKPVGEGLEKISHYLDIQLWDLKKQ